MLKKAIIKRSAFVTVKTASGLDEFLIRMELRKQGIDPNKKLRKQYDSKIDAFIYKQVA